MIATRTRVYTRGMERSWGKTTDIPLEPPEPGGEWELPHWTELVFPNELGELHHGSEGARMPDAVVVRLSGRPVALADAFHKTLDSQYCYLP